MLPLLYRTPSKVIGLVVGFLLFLISFASSIVFGVTEIGLAEVVQSFVAYDVTSNEHVIIQTTRLPRALIATFVGANLAVAGALMQALTRNPLASPSVFGVNAGAVFFIVLALRFLPVDSLAVLVWIAFLGAAVAALTVYLLGSIGRDGLTPVKIVLAGAAISALFTSFTQGLLVLDETGLQDVLFWLAGSIAGRDAAVLYPVLPYMMVAAVTALLLSSHVNILSSGEDIAKGLGQKTAVVKLACAATIVVLAGSSVAVAGAIGFVGLVIPHVARFLVGADYRWVVPFSAVLGAILLLNADIAARFLIRPSELPIGVVTGLIGAPFFIYLARKSFRGKGGS
ncbi:FecCD family ABC transporter permease [Brevibacillus marinus]|uniref:FecCD family ABC transporter permease n=1 Tax=Brevibacillus marinus TaxID=2496837 RepID=UPI000F82B74C|nr:iron ABC transporter permease [Brevibacillus marinus]